LRATTARSINKAGVSIGGSSKGVIVDLYWKRWARAIRRRAQGTGLKETIENKISLAPYALDLMPAALAAYAAKVAIDPTQLIAKVLPSS
jgi:hypothetical protein